MFGVINIVGNFGTVFVDQSYWQFTIAALALVVLPADTLLEGSFKFAFALNFPLSRSHH
jgi:hypothetical protein